MGRPLRIIQNIYPYHLVCRTNNRSFRFNQREVTRIVFKALKETMEKYNLLVHHIVLMSNHYHIIATATEENLHRAMQYFNSRVAVRYNKHVGRSGHLWGDRYRSCIIDTDEHYLACVRYVYRNPKRAKIVDDLEEYADSSFQFWAFGRKIDVAVVEDHLVMRWGRKKGQVGEYFRILVLSEEIWISDQEVKKGLRRMFFGSADFVQQMYTTYCCPQ
ncbi:MAG: transposase [bacterium]|nr:MAG: transposase [bacterium]